MATFGISEKIWHIEHYETWFSRYAEAKTQDVELTESPVAGYPRPSQ